MHLGHTPIGGPGFTDVDWVFFSAISGGDFRSLGLLTTNSLWAHMASTFARFDGWPHTAPVCWSNCHKA